jgi:DNA-binding LacI/PurR family transcriptional regulator
MHAILDVPNRPTAVVTVNDLSAFGALRALHARGVESPREISLIGLDGVTLGEAMYPPLTTIAVSQKELVRGCMRALDHLKADVSKRGLRLNIPVSLLLRGSTGPARLAGPLARRAS